MGIAAAKSVIPSVGNDQPGQATLEYPKYLLDDETMVKVADMGLGRGVNITGCNYQFVDLQIQPSRQVVEQSTIEAGFRQFRRDVRSWSELNNQMQASLAGPFTEAIKLDFGMSVGQNRSSRLMRHYEGQEIHTRTIRFSLAKTQTIQVDYDQEELEDIDLGGIRTPVDSDAVDGDARYGSDSEAVDESLRQRQITIADTYRNTSLDPETASVATSAIPSAEASDIANVETSGIASGAATLGVATASIEASTTELIASHQHKNDSNINTSINQTVVAEDDLSTTSQSFQSLPRIQLLINQEKKRKPNDKINDKKRIYISKQLIKRQNRGATHFVSSIDLGAKVISTRRTRKSKKSSVAAAHARASLHGVGLKSHLSHESLAMATARDTSLSSSVDPRIKTMSVNTIVQPNEERVIGYEVSPIWVLLRDKKWQQAVKEGCRKYVEEEAAKQPPLVGSGGPFFIKVGNYYLMLSKRRDQKEIVRGTEDVKQACNFYIYLPYQQLNSSSSNIDDESDDDLDPMRNAQSGFYIYCEGTKGQLYLTADSSHNDVKLVTSIVSPNARGQFYLQYPSTRKFAALEQWPHNALLLVRKTAWFGRHQYLVITEDRKLKAMFDAFDEETQALCQFKIQHPNPEAPIHTGQTPQTDGETCDELGS